MKIRSLLAVAALLAAGPALAEYVAYSNYKNADLPLPREIGDIEAKYLMDVRWGAYGGKKARLGVLEVDNTSGASTFRIAGLGGNIDFSSNMTGIPVDGIEAILIDALNRTNRFRLVERTELSSIIAEQDLAASGRVAKPSGAKTGNILGAQYLVQLVVTHYEPGTEGKDIGVGGLVRGKVPLLGGLKVKNRQGQLGLNLRLIDAETSEITFSKQIESTIKESGLTFGAGTAIGDLGLGGFMDSFSKTPIGQATIAGINETVFELIKQVGAGAAEGSIVKAEGDRIWLNLGEDSVSNGERLSVYSRGEELIDPDTGISLGGSDTLLGDVEVVEVQAKFSIARPVSLAQTPNRGDKVVSMQPAAELQFASNFNPPK